VETDLLENHNVKESAVAGVPHPQTDQSIIAFVVLKNPEENQITEKLNNIGSSNFSAIGQPNSIFLFFISPK
jgi:acyl-coenzyme A synthetase/AMP-(fatty) acid ligase